MPRKIQYPSLRDMLEKARSCDDVLRINDLASFYGIGNPAFYAFISRYPDTKEELQQIFRTKRLTTAGKPPCIVKECDLPERAKGRCRTHYEEWRINADSSEKIQRYVYPSNEEIVNLFKKYYRFNDVARHIGVPRSTFRDYIKHRPELTEAIEPYRKLPEEVRLQRSRDSRQKWRRNNPEKVKENKRRWASNRPKDTVRRVNRRNSERRAEQIGHSSKGVVRSVEESREYAQWIEIILNDPCVYCGSPSESRDHIVPVNKGGVDDLENIAPACRSCNSSKRDKSLLEFLDWRLTHV